MAEKKTKKKLVDKRPAKKAKKKPAKKAVKKSVKKSNTPNITREFVNGKMVVTFRNGKTREITVEKLETRKSNVSTSVTNRNNRIQTIIDRVANRIANETDADKKTKLQTRLTTIQNRQSNLPTEQEIIDRLQGWIDSANASA